MSPRLSRAAIATRLALWLTVLAAVLVLHSLLRPALRLAFALEEALK